MADGYKYKYDVIRKDVRNKHTQNAGWKKTDHWVVCDVCGCDIRNTDARRRWDNLVTCPDDWEPRHEQDFVRGKADKIAPNGFIRPPTTDQFRDRTYATNTSFVPTTTFGAQIDGTVYVAPIANTVPDSPFPFKVLAGQGATLTDSTDTLTTNNSSDSFSTSNPFYSETAEIKGVWVDEGTFANGGSVQADGAETVDDATTNAFARYRTFSSFGTSGTEIHVVLDTTTFGMAWDSVTIEGTVTIQRSSFIARTTFNASATEYEAAISLAQFNSIFSGATSTLEFTTLVGGGTNGVGYSSAASIGWISDPDATGLVNDNDGATNPILVEAVYFPDSDSFQLCISADVAPQNSNIELVSLVTDASLTELIPGDAAYMVDGTTASWTWNNTGRVMTEREYTQIDIAPGSTFTFTFPVTLGDYNQLDTATLPIILD